MSFDLNACQFTGRLGRDAELRYVKSGDAVANFSMAVSGYGDTTTWVRVNVWGNQAETVSRLRKGERVAVSGSLTVREWETKEGTKASSVELRASSVVFLTPKGERPDEAPDVPKPAKAPSGAAMDDDIPFARERSWP